MFVAIARTQHTQPKSLISFSAQFKSKQIQIFKLHTAQHSNENNFHNGDSYHRWLLFAGVLVHLLKITSSGRRVCMPVTDIPGDTKVVRNEHLCNKYYVNMNSYNEKYNTHHHRRCHCHLAHYSALVPFVCFMGSSFFSLSPLSPFHNAFAICSVPPTPTNKAPIKRGTHHSRNLDNYYALSLHNFRVF